MGQVFYPYEPDQTLLLPPSLRDWVPEGHLAHFVSDTVDELDLKALYDRYEQREDGRGQLAYEPRLLLKLLIYAYAVGFGAAGGAGRDEHGRAGTERPTRTATGYPWRRLLAALGGAMS